MAFGSLLLPLRRLIFAQLPFSENSEILISVKLLILPSTLHLTVGSQLDYHSDTWHNSCSCALSLIACREVHRLLSVCCLL